MKNVILLVSKDAFKSDYLPLYGNSFWKTPNIDELAKNGTVFRHHYTVAPSTAMAFTGMFTGKHPYELSRKDYSHVEKYTESKTLFDYLDEAGYKCHIIWNKTYMIVAKPYAECFGQNDSVEFHLLDVAQAVGAHFNHDKPLVRNEQLSKKALQDIFDTYNSIDTSEKTFIWIHLPHVLKGRIGYGDDVDLLDEFIGFLRKKYGDDSIYFTSDHGNMDLTFGKIGYGFDVYQEAIKIPLITPRISNYSEITFNTSNVDLTNIIINKTVNNREFIISDSAYYAQPHRKTSVIFGRYKYIYNKQTKIEELYDIEYDPNERCNLLLEKRYDIDRKKTVWTSDEYFYPYWDEAKRNYQIIKQHFNSFWKKGTRWQEFKYAFRKKFNWVAWIIYHIKRRKAEKK